MAVAFAICLPLDFYPRSPCGERRRRSVKLFRQNYISIHALLAESDQHESADDMFQNQFLSTLSLRRATFFCRALQNKFPISIHALLAESDPVPRRGRAEQSDFYPRSPCGERRNRKNDHLLPTSNFYPRSPCGERRVFPLHLVHKSLISIHALLAESDPSLISARVA